MNSDVSSFGEGSDVVTTTSSTAQIKRMRHKWTSAFRVMQSLHRLKNPSFGGKSEVCLFVYLEMLRRNKTIISSQQKP
ncbi:unnamed protein product [Onchocerca flexuosa]|uniref:Uncharacterized protein n=1 Tax=Onchocerca flexuosa TaxID=387005 RepID=A0A183HS27_9BILA|nr:unnamed protein product [Onchocerca flexuosa]